MSVSEPFELQVPDANYLRSISGELEMDLPEYLVGASWAELASAGAYCREQRCLPVREMQVLTTLDASEIALYEWPPAPRDCHLDDPGREHLPRILDAVLATERSERGLDDKNAALIGVLAISYSHAYETNYQLQQWGLTRHMGMLDALGTVLVSGLPVSPRALRQAAAFHSRNSVGVPVQPDSTSLEPYAAPDISNVIKHIALQMAKYRRSAVAPYVRAECRGINRYLGYLLPGDKLLATYDAEDRQPAWQMYRYIRGQVRGLQESVWQNKSEIKREYIRRYGRFSRRPEIRRRHRELVRGVGEGHRGA